MSKPLIIYFLLTLYVYMIAGCTTLPKPIVSDSQTLQQEKTNTIFITSHGWHTGIVINGNDLFKKLPFLRDRFPKAQYFEVGWGDKRFYQADEVTTTLAIQAIIWPTSAVLHIVSFQEHPSVYFTGSNVFELKITQENYSNVLSFIESSFSKTTDGQIISLQSGIYGTSQFYKAIGSYFMFNTCNTWVAKSLSSSGFDINERTTLTADGITSYLELLAE